jgi:hypothetical protein
MQEKKQSQIYSNIANAKTSGDLLSALKRAASGPTAKAILQREANQPRKYWFRSESLADSTVTEVVCEMFGGKILQQRNANWQVELTPEAAKFINDRYHWRLQ